MDFGAIWADWPARTLSGTMKWYLLVQLSFWMQQILVVNIEEWRKDHYQMLSHHCITSALLGSAYIYGFYNVSNVVLCLMDIVDVLLPVRGASRSKPSLLLTYARLPNCSSTSNTKQAAPSPLAS